VRLCERNNSAGTKVSEEGGGKSASGTIAEISLQPMEVHGGADIHQQHTEDPMTGQVDPPKGGCDPVGSLHWSRLLAGPVDL